MKTKSFHTCATAPQLFCFVAPAVTGGRRAIAARTASFVARARIGFISGAALRFVFFLGH